MSAEKILKFFGIIPIFASLAAGAFMIFFCRVLGPAGAFAGAAAAAVCGSMAGKVFIKFFLPDLAESFSWTLLFPRSFLKEPPFETGAVYALMRGPEPWKAEEYLNALPPEKKRQPEAVLAKIELYRDILKRPDAALESAKEYLALRGRRESPCGKAILMSFADLAADSGEPGLACDMLKRELKRSIYTETEKKEIRLRLDAMTNQTWS